VLVVQQIRATYLKDGRGGEEAQRRAALPLGSLLPDWSGEPGYVLHDLCCEGPDYALRSVGLETSVAPPRHARFLRFDEGMHWRGGQAGMPPRPDISIALEGRRWVRLRFNGRRNDWHYGEFSLWRYLDVTVNVGRFAAPPPANIFVSEEPDHVIDLRAALW